MGNQGTERLGSIAEVTQLVMAEPGFELQPLGPGGYSLPSHQTGLIFSQARMELGIHVYFQTLHINHTKPWGPRPVLWESWYSRKSMHLGVW